MNIYIVERNNNKELYSYLKKKHIIVDVKQIDSAQAIVVSKVYNVKDAFNIIDFALDEGKEIICIKNKFAREHYVCNYLIKNGAMYV